MDLLFDNLEALIDAPNGIEKTRELILQLAVQGKLTGQDPKDGPASELLKKIKKEKDKLITEGKNKKQNELPSINDDEKPFELPDGWSFERLGNVSELINGVTYSKSESSEIPLGDYLPILRANNIKGKINFDNLVYVPAKRISSNQLLKKFDNVIAMSSGSKSLVGKSAQLSVNFDGSFGAFCGVLRSNEEFNSGFINYFLQSPYYREGIAESSQGIGINNLRKENLLHLIIPVPPYEEQKRIVEKVNSLMSLLDELEEKRERRNQKRIKLNNASLEKLPTSKDDKELKTNWKRIEENFSTLYTVPENVEKLKQAILQLAVQGKLVKQDPNDEPASELLKKINKEKEKLIAEGKIKKQKELSLIKDEEKPFELPKGWEWVRLDHLGETQTGTTPTKSDMNNFGDYIPFIGPGDILDFEIDYNKNGLSQQGLSNGRLIRGGSILMVCIGGSIGKSAINEIDVTCNQQLNTITPYINQSLQYLFYSLNTPIFQKSVINNAGGSATPIINKQRWINLLVPLPPLNEQKRIVEKVNELMSLCNALEEKLTKKETTAEEFVGSVVDRVANSSVKENTKKNVIRELTIKHDKALIKLS